MRFKKLILKGVGPFKHENTLEFITDSDDLNTPPVTIITGENGTGKSYVLDAIRAFYLYTHNGLRPIFSDKENGMCSMEYNTQDKMIVNSKYVLSGSNKNIRSVNNFNYIVDYWSPTLNTDPYTITQLKAIDIDKELDYSSSLLGIQKNSKVTELITAFDYLRSSDDPKEKEQGEVFYTLLKAIVEQCTNGVFSHVRRRDYAPIIRIFEGVEVELAQLSSGNLYLLQRLVGLLAKMYAFVIKNGLPITELGQAKGILLIDEIESHLHPKWQKTVVPMLQNLFPNLQIILTTHSPFIVASVKNARIFVCKSLGTHSSVEDETANYANLPIDEILASELFGATQPFNLEISILLKQRKEAIHRKDKAEEERIETELKRLNPDYFAYLDLDKLLRTS